MDKQEQQNRADMILDLNFVPTWARQPPTDNPYAEARGEGAPSGDDRRRPRRGEGRDRGGRPQDRPRGTSGRRDDRSSGGRPERREGPAQYDRRPQTESSAPESAAPLPVEVSFLPHRDCLSLLVHDVQVSGYAYPLMYLASQFLAKPERCLVKLEARRGEGVGPAVRFFQCKECKAVFLDREAVANHVKAHMDRFFTKEELKAEPPSGNFVCIARCRRSGILLGPPNHHGYNEKLLEVHRTRFPSLSLDMYRESIEMVRDPALIEQWKQESSTQTIYRLRNQDNAPVLKRAEAEALFVKQYAPACVVESPRVIVSAAQAQQISDGRLKEAIRNLWYKESRFPFTLSLALRPALRHMHLHFFKVKQSQTFVVHARPHPIDPEKTVEPIRGVLHYLKAHPGCTRQQLVEGLRPGVSPDSPDAADLLNPLRWLIERGHVIEFFNGTLSVPAAGSRQTDTKAEAKPSLET